MYKAGSGRLMDNYMLRKTQYPSQRRYDTHPINTLCHYVVWRLFYRQQDSPLSGHYFVEFQKKIMRSPLESVLVVIGSAAWV